MNDHGCPTREDTWLVTVTVGDRALGVFDGFSGGEVDSEEALYSPGGMAAEISLGGRRTIGNVTVNRYCDRALDWPLIKWLTAQVGVGALLDRLHAARPVGRPRRRRRSPTRAR